MGTEHFTQFLPAACAGFGLFLAGAVNLLLVRRGWPTRLVATAAVVGLTVLAARSLDQPGVAAATARLLAIALVPYLVLNSAAFTARAAALLSALQTSAARFGLLTAAGVGLVLGSIVQLELADDESANAALASLEVLTSRSPSVPSPRTDVTTDRGSRIVLRVADTGQHLAGLDTVEENLLRATGLDEYVIRCGPADYGSNCFGWVFCGGQYFLSDADVELILAENGYKPVDTPRPGDVVVYRFGPTIVHAAVVRYTTPGQPVMVEGKWGNLGVFLHPADQSPYGTAFQFYRSARTGHLLAGLGGRRVTPPEIKLIPAD